MDTHEWPCRIKSARRKKRLVKTDRDKQLIQLSKRRGELWHQRRQLPPVALERPYQSGWKRIFVLREDIKRSPMAAFYEELLQKINTIEYHHDRSFKRKKRRKGRYAYFVKQQMLREFTLQEWNSAELPLSEKEKACFTLVETYSTKNRLWQIRYVFNHPWRYRLKVAPHIITHTTPLDVDLEREIACIDNRVENYLLEPRIYLLTRGRGYNRNKWYNEPAKYINKLKNTPRYSQIDAYLELET